MEILKHVKFPRLNLVTRNFVEEFFDTVTEGVAHGVYKVVSLSCFCVILQHKENGGKWRLSVSDSRLYVCSH